MASEDIEKAGRAAREVAIPLVGLGGKVLTNDTNEQILAVRFVMGNAQEFLFSWLAARAFQYKARLQDALDYKKIADLPQPISPVDDLHVMRIGRLCEEIERFDIPRHLLSDSGLACESAVFIVPPTEAVIRITTNNGQSACVVLDVWAIYMFIAMVSRAQASGLFDEQDVLPSA